jgi:signal transduction histidine kinase
MMSIGFQDGLAARMRAAHATLAARWFDRLHDLLPVDARDVFPTASLLDHIPALIVDISHYIGAPEQEAIAANTLVVDKARELGTLRHHQRASLHQLLREYQLLSGVLTAFLQEELARASTPPTPAESVEVMTRMHQAVAVQMQETIETFVRLYTQTIAQQAERLEQFTRIATHEWRQPLNSLQFGISLLRQPGITSDQSARTLDVVERNVAHLVQMTQMLEGLARMPSSGDGPIIQEVSLGTLASQAARQLREMAEARDVRLRVSDDLPSVVVDAGRLELALVNLLSNAIKYADPNKRERFVEVVPGPGSATAAAFMVRDNGIGIPADRLGTIFERFSRAHADKDDLYGVTGVGLGLSIVADCVQTVGGQIDVASIDGVGTSFTVTVPRSPGPAVASFTVGAEHSGPTGS